MPGVGGEGGPSIGSDGTVYVGLGERITAVAPDGTIRWTFIEPTVGQGVIAGPTVGTGREHLRGLGPRRPWCVCALAGRRSPVEQPGRSQFPRVRAARRGDRLRLREALRLVRRVPSRAERDDVRAYGRRDAGLGGGCARRERHLHAAPGAARRGAGRKSVPDRFERPVWVGARPVRPEHGLGRLDVHAVARERDVATVSRPRRLDLPLAEPQLSRRRQPGWGWPLVVLRRHDHRPAPGEPRREPRRGGRSPELRRAGPASWLGRSRWDSRVHNGATNRGQRVPDRLHGAAVLVGQLDCVRGYGDVQPS